MENYQDDVFSSVSYLSKASKLHCTLWIIPVPKSASMRISVKPKYILQQDTRH